MAFPTLDDTTKNVLSWLDVQAGEHTPQSYFSTFIASTIGANLSVAENGITTNETSTRELNNLFNCYKNYRAQQKNKMLEPVSEEDASLFLNFLAENKHVRALETLKKLGADSHDIKPRMVNYNFLKHFSFSNHNDLSEFEKHFGHLSFNKLDNESYFGLENVKSIIKNISDHNTQSRMTEIIFEYCLKAGNSCEREIEPELSLLIRRMLKSKAMSEDQVLAVFQRCQPLKNDVILNIIEFVPQSFTSNFNTKLLFELLNADKKTVSKRMDIINRLIDSGSGINFKSNNKNGKSLLDVAKELELDILIKTFEKFSPTNIAIKEAEVYKELLEPMSKMIITGTESKPDLGLPDSYKKMKIFTSNLDGYYENENHGGNTLNISIDGKTYPIGYTVFIPPEAKNNISHVVVSVYGGLTSNDLDTANIETDVENLLYQNGSPVIRLLLPDLLQDNQQLDMTKELQNIIHECINQFHKSITNEPDKLDPRLKKMKFDEAEYFLLGGSFGGRTAIRHGQLYPHTFQGYISYNGGLSELQNNDMPIVSGRFKLRRIRNPKDILPIYHTKDSVDPILLLHNRDDNNANVLNSINFYEALANKNIARLCVFEKGNPTSRRDMHIKGHFLPRDQQRYLDVFKKFINHEVAQIPEFNRMSLDLHKRTARQHQFVRYDYKDRFLALATAKFYHKDNRAHLKLFQKDKKAWNKIWNTEYLPLLYATQEIEKTGFIKRDKTIKHLNEKGLITEEVIKNTIKNHASKFRELYQELIPGTAPTVDEICNNSYIQAVIKQHLVSPDRKKMPIEVYNFLKDNLFLGNPQLIQSIPDELLNFTKNDDVAKNLREQFEESLMKSSKLRRNTWIAAAKLAKGKPEFENKTSSMSKEEKSKLSGNRPQK